MSEHETSALLGTFEAWDNYLGAFARLEIRQAQNGAVSFGDDYVLNQADAWALGYLLTQDQRSKETMDRVNDFVQAEPAGDGGSVWLDMRLDEDGRVSVGGHLLSVSNAIRIGYRLLELAAKKAAHRWEKAA